MWRVSDENLRLVLGPPLAENGAPDPNLVAAHGDGALKVLAHAHAQLQLPVEAELLDDEVALLFEGDEVLVLGLGGRGLAARDGADGHEAEQPEGGALFLDEAAEGHGVVAGDGAGLGLLAGRVDLDVDAEGLDVGFGGDEVGAGGVEEGGFLLGVEGGEAEEVGDAGELLGVVGLEAADEVPGDGAGEEGGLLGELLGVVLAEVGDGGRGVGVQGEDVVGGLQLGDGDETDLGVLAGSFLGWTFMRNGRVRAHISAVCHGAETLGDGLELGDESLGSGGVDLHLGLRVAHCK